MLYEDEKDRLYEIGIREMTYGLGQAVEEEMVELWHELSVYDEFL